MFYWLQTSRMKQEVLEVKYNGLLPTGANDEIFFLLNRDLLKKRFSLSSFSEINASGIRTFALNPFS